ncbi:Leucine--tRNA ligase [Buchnera aphidicola (Tuberolachnus salignus)]|uniref:Leucine--tRNA ligase n=1 Tax=Buchnera aphidicola subsp. Tuberolachnus salignus TaxID=98804 RepID=A0A160SYZ7_BUCTT|nr:leucine--tRNA ligase [Buchnera aphidicola]CUR53261.1 Leucine--tRNA ligase [Buchnera aphidicola (Tuberolachnus salignus)]
MDQEYNPREIEHVVQKYWEIKKTFQVSEKSKKKKFYCLPMMPYPSGNLHMGHIRNYTISDIISRFQRLLGKNVLQPIGWDAFGLPAEQAALTKNINPKKWTLNNIQNMRIQLKNLGFSYDWNREIMTCSSKYYRWEQWFFIQLYKKKLIYKKNTQVNWCPQDKTVLANEQVIQNSCWRCQTPIIFKKKSQWFLKITTYAEELLNNLKMLPQWPVDVINMQKKWIGKSIGLNIEFQIIQYKKKILIYTTKPNTILDVEFLVLSPDHSFLKILKKKNEYIKKFIKNYKKNYLNKEKFLQQQLYGINTQHYVIHPITKKKIPIWSGYYVKSDYATGAIMAVPLFNQIDLNFSIFNNIKIKKKNITKKNFFTKKNDDVIKKLINKKIAYKVKYYKLKDWSISRQRYWGAPIPAAYEKTGKIIMIPENQLPVLLPKNLTINKNKNVLKNYKKWKNVKIKNKIVQRETDTLDTFFESSWYYIRYTNPHFFNGMIDFQKAKYWLPIDVYIGGIEHAILHLMYFRFFHKLLRDFGLLKTDEPAKKLLCQGMVLEDAFYYFSPKKEKIWIQKKKIKILFNSRKKIISAMLKDGTNVHYAGKIKMSKSKKNGINPKKILKKYGSDTLRLFLMFAAPIESSLEWQENGLIGMHRFLKKIWNLVYIFKKNIIIQKKNIIPLIKLENIHFKLNNTIFQVTQDLKKKYSFNTAISHIIKFFNYFKKKIQKYNIKKKFIKKTIQIILLLLYPFTPHICFVLWKEINQKITQNIDQEKWPVPNLKYLLPKTTNIIIQINGKKRHIFNVNTHKKKYEIILKIIKKENIKKYFKNHDIIKIIYVPLKIINFVIK